MLKMETEQKYQPTVEERNIEKQTENQTAEQFEIMFEMEVEVKKEILTEVSSSSIQETTELSPVNIENGVEMREEIFTEKSSDSVQETIEQSEVNRENGVEVNEEISTEKSLDSVKETTTELSELDLKITRQVEVSDDERNIRRSPDQPLPENTMQRRVALSEKSRYARQRIAFSERELNALNSAYEAGLTSAKKRKEIDQLAEVLGIPSVRIQNWIGNKRKKEKEHQPAVIREKERSGLVRPTSYNIFCRGLSLGNSAPNSFKDWASKWNSLDSHERKKYRERALMERQHPEKWMDMNPKLVQKRQLERISNACDILASIGVETGGIAVDSAGESLSVFGSTMGVQFFNRQAIKSEFTSMVIGPCKSDVPNTEEQRTILRQKIRRIFRDVWAKASGKKEQVPYKAIKQKLIKIKVSGFPTDVTFKDPSSYGVKTMMQILEKKKEIVLDILSDGRNESEVGIRNNISAAYKR